MIRDIERVIDSGPIGGLPLNILRKIWETAERAESAAKARRALYNHIRLFNTLYHWIQETSFITNPSMYTEPKLLSQLEGVAMANAGYNLVGPLFKPSFIPVSEIPQGHGYYPIINPT